MPSLRCPGPSECLRYGEVVLTGAAARGSLDMDTVTGGGSATTGDTSGYGTDFVPLSDWVTCSNIQTHISQHAMTHGGNAANG